MKKRNDTRNNKRIGLWTGVVMFALALGIGAMQGSTFAAISSHLAQSANVGPLSPPTSHALLASPVGDANGDNVVDTIDFAILKGTFGRACGDLLFDARADFNNSCVVNALDFNILKRNFGLLVGGPLDPPPPDTSGGAHLFIRPGQGGSPTCSAPAHNGTIEAGCRFVLEFIVDAGGSSIAAAQSYLTFDPQLIKNARVSSLGTSCVPTGTLTADLTTFDATLQNEVCIGPSSCTFRNVLSTPPGSIGYAAGALANCETGCSGVFRIAQIGLCAVTPGQVILHWQFWPTDGLRNRHSDIATVVDANGVVTLVQDSASFADYVFTITPPAATGRIEGTTYRHDPSQPPDTVLGGAPVQACATNFNFCRSTTSLANGTYTVSNLPDGNYRVTAYPPSGPTGADLTQGLINNLINISGGGAVIGQDVVLNTVLLPPAGTTILPSQPGGNGVPRVNWTQILTLRTTGCVGTGTYELHLDNGVVLTGNMVGDGSGNYTANIGRLNPNHGFGSVVMTIMCSGGGTTAVTFNIYIDPSGNVKTVEGVPIQGATVTLYRSNSLSGPFTQVANGDSIMSEENRVNPDTTDADGHFGWDVIAGYYKVRAEKAGCVSPSDPNQTYVESGALTIPPPVTDLDLRLNCSAVNTDTPTITPTRTATVTQTNTPGDSPTPTNIPTETDTPGGDTPTITPTRTSTITQTNTPGDSPTPTNTPTETNTPGGNTPTITPTPTSTVPLQGNGAISGTIYRYPPNTPASTPTGTSGCVTNTPSPTPIPTATIPLPGAYVYACRNGSGYYCAYAMADASGQYTLSNLPNGEYTLGVNPPASANDLLAGTLDHYPVISNGGMLTGQDLVLNSVAPLPQNATISPNRSSGNSVPLVYWLDPLTLIIHGCAGGVATYQIYLGSNVVRSDGMTEGPAGTYTANIPALNPIHGYARIATTIVCPCGGALTTSFSLYIDPSGNVRTVAGDPIIGATVTLYRADDPGGPFVQVPNGDAIMSPVNRTNPDTTDGHGHFGWDVVAGYYKVRAEHAGCVSPNNPNQPYVESGVLPIPPPVTDLDLRLSCPAIANVHLTWQGIPQPDARNNGQTATLNVCNAGVANSYSVTTDQNGNFSAVINLPSGSYNWQFKGRKSLARAGTIAGGNPLVTSGGTASLEAGTQNAGDANNNNLITIVDVGILRATFSKTLGDPGYDERADFNNDNTVGASDFNLLRVNFGQVGASLTCP